MRVILIIVAILVYALLGFFSWSLCRIAHLADEQEERMHRH